MKKMVVVPGEEGVLICLEDCVVGGESRCHCKP